MHEIKSVDTFQNAKVIGTMYAVISSVAGVLLALGALFRGHPGRALMWLFLVPATYTAAGFIFVAILCLVYNEVARRIGGVQFELTSSDPGNRV